MSFLKFNEKECKEDELVVEDSSSVQTKVLAFHGYYAGEDAKTFTMLWNNVSEQLVRDYLWYLLKMND